MMDLLLATSGGEAQVAGGGYVDDVFSAYTYTGNGATQTINNGIDLAGKGGLVWLKNRTSAGDHYLFDTARGALNELNSNNAEASASLAGSLTAFLNNGFSVGGSAAINQSGQGYVGWQFRKAPKFFDVVTYTGNGVAGRQIAHSLGVAPGMVIVKNITEAASWKVWHRTLALNHGLVLNSSNAIEGQAWLYSTAPTDSLITIGNAGADAIESNKVGNTYVAYLFAHDPSAEGIIQCGSYTTDDSGSATVNLGWANGSQFAMIKAASATGDWEMYDTARTSAWSGNDARLRANLSNAEDSVARISASGTSITFAGLSANSTYIYMVVRSPS